MDNEDSSCQVIEGGISESEDSSVLPRKAMRCMRGKPAGRRSHDSVQSSGKRANEASKDEAPKKRRRLVRNSSRAASDDLPEEQVRESELEDWSSSHQEGSTEQEATTAAHIDVSSDSDRNGMPPVAEE